MKKLDSDKIAKFEKLRKAIAEQEPVRAKAINAYNAAIQAALRKLHEAGGLFFSYWHEIERLHSQVALDIQVAVEEAEVSGRVVEARHLQAWLDAWEEIGAGMSVRYAYDAGKFNLPNPPVSSLMAILPFRLENVMKHSTGDWSIDPNVMASVESSWRRIDAWLTENVPSLMAKMGAGATQEAIAKAEMALGVALPDDVRASYAVHDGSGANSLFPSGYYLSLHEMARRYGQWKQLVEQDGGFDDEESKPKGPIQKVHYHLKWIPLTHDGGGDHTLIDLAPAEGGKVGQLIDFSHETGPEVVAAPGLAEYLATIADGLESGAGQANEEDAYIEWRQRRGTARSAFSLPPTKATSAKSSLKRISKRYFEFTAGTSNKFWEIAQEGGTMTTRYGKIGMNGQSTTKSYDSSDKAIGETVKMIAKKVKEGYVEKAP